MRRNQLILIIVAAIGAIVCVKLGVWQLSRLGERRQANALIQASITKPPIQITNSLPKFERYRKVVLRGHYDYKHELIVPNRTRNGSPGVHVLTPLLIIGNDTALLVNRGWVYSADGKTTDLNRWREADTLSGILYMDATPQRTIPAIKDLPYAVAPYQAVLTGNPAFPPPSVDSVPPRLEIPPLSEGNHLSYAMQWFSFAVIALVGTFIFVRKSRKPRDS